jgi:hypothetical protein
MLDQGHGPADNSPAHHFQTEAEFVAASEASKEAVWLIRLLKEVKEER